MKKKTQIGQHVVSVIIPVYNRAHLLTDVINSVLEQTYRPHEIIVVDDASHDNPEAIAKCYPEVRFFRNEKNLGAAGARNVGASHATGVILAFLDSDDHWLPDKLENQIQVFEKSSVEHLALVYGSYLRYDRKGGQSARLIQARYRGNLKRPLLRFGNVISNFSNFVVKKEVWDELGGLDLRFPPKEDFEFYLRLALNGYGCDYTEKPVFKKFLGDAEQITSKPRLKIQGNLRYYHAYRDEIRSTMNSNFIANLATIIQLLGVSGKHWHAKRVTKIMFAYFPTWRHPMKLRFYIRAIKHLRSL